MPNQVFLSYSSIHDLNGTVSQFHQNLENEIQQNSDPSVTIFLDQKGINSGSSWGGALSSALDECSVFLILLSPSWLHSEWCRKEYQYFKSLQGSNDRKVIIPVLWVNTTFADAQNNMEKQEIIKQLDELQQVNWLQHRYNTNLGGSLTLRRAVGELGATIADFIKGFTVIIKYPFGFEEKAKSDEPNPAILAKRISQATILTNFIPTWLIAENEFDPIGNNPSDDELKKIKDKLPTFIATSIYDQFSAEFFKTNYNALPEVEAMLAAFRLSIQVYKRDLDQAMLKDDEAIKVYWGYLLKGDLFQLRINALKIKEAAEEIFNNSIAALT